MNIRTKLNFRLVTSFWAMFILVLCSISFGKVGNSSLFFPGFDKLAHCGLFFVFTSLLYGDFIRGNAFSRLSFLQACTGVFISVFFGGLIELLQRYIFTWRSGEWADLFADSVGTCMALFAVLITMYALNSKRQVS